MPETDQNCTVIVCPPEGFEVPTIAELQKNLESSRDDVKAKALTSAILCMLSQQGGGGDVMAGVPGGGNLSSRLLMTVIRYVVPSNNHRVKKLLQIYWEIVDKTKADGGLKEEMILVCNALRNDLIHPNEFIRGTTLRLLCKMRYYKVIEPLVEAIMQNLTHRHSYVRRNAVMCVHALVKTFGLDVIPHATDEVEKLLLSDNDLCTKRNAFLMLLHCDTNRALSYVLSVQDSIRGLGDTFQLVVLELLRKVCRQQAHQKGALLRLIVNLIESSSPTVACDGAASLVGLSSSPVALKAATEAYVKLLLSQSDNNVKLIVLDRLADILRKHQGILEHFVMDILRALSCPTIDVRKKALEIALRLVSHRTIQDVVNVLKKEIVKTTEPDAQATNGNQEYQRLLIRAVRNSCSRYPEVAQSVMHILLDFMSEADLGTATEVVFFLRETVAQYADLRPSLLNRLADSILELSQSRVVRVSLWILGEYVEEVDLRHRLVSSFYNALKPMPFLRSDEAVPTKTTATEEATDAAATTTNAAAADKGRVKISTRTVILKDGTYGTEDVYEAVAPEAAAAEAGTEMKPAPIRDMIRGGDFHLISVLGVALTKLALKELEGEPIVTQPTRSRIALMVSSLLLFTRKHPNAGEQSDGAIRLTQCLRAIISVLAADLKKIRAWRQHLFRDTRENLAKAIEAEREAAKQEVMGQGGLLEASSDDDGEGQVEPDDPLVFRQLRERRGPVTDALDDDEMDVHQAALGGNIGVNESLMFQQRLAKVQQMTGLADPVYVEAFLQVTQFDLTMELLIINRTSETLQNVAVELSTHGDLKVVDRPPSVILAPGEAQTVRASLKVQSIETGIIFGYVTYDRRSAADKECLVLNELHMDLLDYVQRSWIGDLSFRSMWQEFEWENKITINTAITDVGAFLEHIMRQTNMTIVGKYAIRPQAGKSGVPKTVDKQAEIEEYFKGVRNLPMLKKLTQECNFVAVNLYSRSVFGEDALANVSIEKLADGKLAGNVRIRSRTQGIALSLGDRITLVQRNLLR